MNYAPIQYNPYVPPSAPAPFSYQPSTAQTAPVFDEAAFNDRLKALLGFGSPAQAAGAQTPNIPQPSVVDPMAQQSNGGRPMNEFATPLQSQASLQGSAPSSGFNQAAPGPWDTLRDKTGKWLAGNIAQTVPAMLGGAFGTAVAGPAGGVVGGMLGGYIGKDLKSTIMNPVEGNDPYAKFRPVSNNPQYDTVSGNESMPMEQQYASYGAGTQGQNNGGFASPTSDSYANYTPGSYSGYTTGSNENYKSDKPTTGNQSDNDNRTPDGADTSGGSY